MRNYIFIIFIFLIKCIFSSTKFLSFTNQESPPNQSKKIYKLVLVRHGQSVWNLENRFTGWTDVSLSKQGIKEAINAGKLLNVAN